MTILGGQSDICQLCCFSKSCTIVVDLMKHTKGKQVKVWWMQERSSSQSAGALFGPALRCSYFVRAQLHCNFASFTHLSPQFFSWKGCMPVLWGAGQCHPHPRLAHAEGTQAFKGAIAPPVTLWAPAWVNCQGILRFTSMVHLAPTCPYCGFALSTGVS